MPIEDRLFTDADHIRIDHYNRLDALRQGRFAASVHKNVKASSIDRLLEKIGFRKQKSRDTVRLAMNVPGFISKTWADLLFLDFPKLGSKDEVEGEDEWLDEYQDKNCCDTVYWESAWMNSALGDSYQKILLEEGADVPKALPIDPRNVLPRLADDDSSRVLYYDVVTRMEEGDKAMRRAFVERHYPGRVEFHMFLIDDVGNIKEHVGPDSPGAEGGLEGMPGSVQETGVDDFLVIHTPNMREPGMFHGVSDYDMTTPDGSAFEEISHRLSRMAVALDILADPKLQGPADHVNARGEFKYSGANYLSLRETPNSRRIEPIIWDAKITEQLEYLGHLVEMTLAASEVWSGLFHPDKFGQSESGRALKMKMMRTVWGRNRKRKYYRYTIQDSIRIAQELQSNAPGRSLGFEPARPSVDWSDVLPFDRFEAAQEESLKKGSGLTSVESAIQRLNPKLSQEELEAELERLEVENEPAFSTINDRGRDEFIGVDDSFKALARKKLEAEIRSSEALAELREVQASEAGDALEALTQQRLAAAKRGSARPGG